jgi:hypothetical protein
MERPVINSSRRFISTAAVLCSLGAAALASPIVSDAGADVVNPTSLVNLSACNLSALTQPFARWLDLANYELAPGGDFESSTWTLTGGAQLVAGSEPYAATGHLGSSSLSLPAGASARSPLTCVDAAYPSIRFFVAGHGSVAVSIVDGSTVLPAGIAIAGREWSPTLIMVTDSAVLGALSGGTAQVSLAFRGLSGDPQIDDVFVDPWSHG